MKTELSISEKTQYLTDTYLEINEEGRDLLDIVMQKLKEMRGEPEDVENIRHLTFTALLKNIINK